MLKNNSSRPSLSGANKVPVISSTSSIKMLSDTLTFYFVYYVREDDEGNKIKDLVGIAYKIFNLIAFVVLSYIVNKIKRKSI
jgi:ABC-type multidrug transport system permease subunit